jgi:hypothetical protein
VPRLVDPLAARPYDCYINVIGPRKIDFPSTWLIPCAGLEVNAGNSKRERLTTKKVFEKLQQEAG